MKTILAVALTAATLATTAQAQQVVAIPQDDSFRSGNIRWSGATAKGYDAQIALKNMGGKLALCGVGIITNIQISTAAKNALRGGYIKINGKTVLKDFSFFAKAKSVRALKTTNANCKITNAAFPKRSDDFEINYGKGTFRN